MGSLPVSWALLAQAFWFLFRSISSPTLNILVSPFNRSPFSTRFEIKRAREIQICLSVEMAADIRVWFHAVGGEGDARFRHAAPGANAAADFAWLLVSKLLAFAGSLWYHLFHCKSSLFR